MKFPSIDRINPQKGYTKSNCRYLERSENSRLGRLGVKDIPKMQCKYGHLLDAINTYICRADNKRRCRKCNAIRNKRYYAKLNS